VSAECVKKIVNVPAAAVSSCSDLFGSVVVSVIGKPLL